MRKTNGAAPADSKPEAGASSRRKPNMAGANAYVAWPMPTIKETAARNDGQKEYQERIENQLPDCFGTFGDNFDGNIFAQIARFKPRLILEDAPSLLRPLRWCLRKHLDELPA